MSSIHRKNPEELIVLCARKTSLLGAETPEKLDLDPE
jgi:hypothetical protein